MSASTPPLFLPDVVSVGAIASRLKSTTRTQIKAVNAQIEQISPVHTALTFFRLAPGSTFHLGTGQAHLTTSDEPATAPAPGDPWIVVQTACAGERIGRTVRYPLGTGPAADVPLDSALHTFDFFRDLLFGAESVSMADPRAYEALELVYSIADFEWDGDPDALHPAPCRLHSTVNVTLKPGCLVLESSTGDSFFRGFAGLTASHVLQNVNGEVHVSSPYFAHDTTTAQAAVLTRERIRVWS